MQSSKLVKVLKTFTVSDWKALQARLASPLYTKPKEGKELLRLLELLKKSYPKFDSPKLNKANVLILLAKDNPAKPPVLDKLMNKLMRHIEALLLAANQRMEHRSGATYLELAKCWRTRNLPQLEAAALQKAEKRYLNNPAYERDDYWQFFRLAEEWVSYYSTRRSQELGQYLHQAEARLDDWCLLAKLEQAVWQCAQKIQAKYESSPTLLPRDAVLALINPQQLANYPLHKIYYYVFVFLSGYEEANQAAFQQVSEQLQLHGQLLEPSKRKALQTILRIFAAGRYNRGQEEYLQISHLLYREHLESGLLYFDEKIHSQTLLNLVTLGLRMDEHKWVEKLLQEHPPERILDQVNAQEAIRFNWALYAFYQNDWAAATQYLDDSYQNIYYQLAARRLELMIYQQEKSPLLEARIAAFKVYIFRQRKQIPAKQWELNNNFIDLFRQVLHPSSAFNPKRINRLSQKLMDTDYIAERNWLAKQLKDLLKN